MRDLDLTAAVTYAAHSEAARAAHRDARHRPIDVPVHDRGAAHDASREARIAFAPTARPYAQALRVVVWRLVGGEDPRRRQAVLIDRRGAGPKGRPHVVGYPIAGFAFLMSESAICGNQAPAAGSFRPQSGSNSA